jgi:hypothetical protein
MILEFVQTPEATPVGNLAQIDLQAFREAFDPAP